MDQDLWLSSPVAARETNFCAVAIFESSVLPLLVSALQYHVTGIAVPKAENWIRIGTERARLINHASPNQISKGYALAPDIPCHGFQIKLKKKKRFTKRRMLWV